MAVCAVLVVSGLAWPASPARALASCAAPVGQDFDDDGRADLVVARTLPSTQAGVVDIIMSGGARQTISAGSVGFESAADDRFGAAVHISSLDTEDNCPDLVIGAPGTAGGGAVYIVRGTGEGVDDSAIRVAAPASTERFGASVGILGLPLTRAHLLVGAPGRDEAAAADAGGLLIWQLEAGIPTGSPTVITYADFGGSPAAGDHLGAVLAVTDAQVTLGVPDRDVGAARDAGEVITFSVVDSPGPIQVADWTLVNQNSPGAPGVAEAGDRFGASVDGSGAMVLVGVPGEDIGGRANVGMVARFIDLGSHTAGGWVSWHQNIDGVPGVNEAGDRFGAAVHLGWVEVLEDGDPVGRPVFVIGAPGEDIGSTRDAGAITVLAPGVRPGYGLSQADGLPGAAERGDQVGAALGDLPGEYDGPYFGGDGIVVGAPGEDLGGVTDAGLVMFARGLLPRAGFGWTSVRTLGGAVAGGRYGWTLPRA